MRAPAHANGRRTVLAAGTAVTITLGAGASAAPPARAGLASPREKEIAMELVSSAENSSLNWRAQYGTSRTSTTAAATRAGSSGSPPGRTCSWSSGATRTYYDAAVVHGTDGLRAIRARALRRADTPAQGGDETRYLNAVLDERDVEMRKEAAHSDLSRIEDEQRRFLREGNLNLLPPLRWSTYGGRYQILH